MVTSMALALAVAGVVGQESKATPAEYNPVADPKATVVVNNARFTILTPALIRMEWSPDGQFEDRASFAFINRNLPVPQFKVSSDQDWTTIDTARLTLRYKNTGEKFRKANLSIEMNLGGKKVVWKPRLKDTGNLFGTTRTLDGVSGSCPLEPGLLSRDGWTVVDDSKRLLFDNSDWPWVTTRKNKRALDWYFFGYGHDYAKALSDFTKVAGKIPLPPRFVFGTWWSRYWAYSEDELRDLVKQFHDHDVPLDVLVIDMDWHLDGWTGYTWNPKYFPDPDNFLKWVHQQGLRATLNLHPAEGVGKHEKAFPEMAKAMGLDPETADRVPFDCTDRKYMDAYFNILHHPMEKQGIDFWWIDWQQGGKSKVAGLDPLFWLNYLHWTDMERRESETHRRPILFSRWGGLGNHRYQVGFSGDTFSVWPSLAFQPYFTSTAGNVGYDYWSHDIGGHQPGPAEPEMYARWIQWGALSPVLRTHTTKNPKSERRIWEFPKEVFESARKAFWLRYELIPYIYTSARKCYDTAMPLCRPLYYEWPELPEAYEHGGEYLFGDQMLVAPVAEPMDNVSRCAQVKVWLPPGEWTNWFTGRTYKGPCDARLLVPLDEIPLFVRSGGIIPTQPKMNRTAEKPVDPLILNIFPGDSGETRVYEDDGIGPGYKTNQCAWTPVSHKLVNGERHITIGPVEGSYAGMLKERRHEIRLYDSLGDAESILVDGNLLKYEAKDPNDYAPGWFVYGHTMGPIIQLPAIPASEQINVVIKRAPKPSQAHAVPSGFRGIYKLLYRYRKAVAPQILCGRGDGTSQESAGPEPPEEELSEEEAVSVGFPMVWGEFPDLPDQIQSQWLDLLKAAQQSNLSEQDKKEAIIRLLGFFSRLSVQPPAVGSKEVSATIDVAPTLNVPALVGLSGEVKLSAAEPWRIDGQSEWKTEDLSEAKPLIGKVTLSTDGDMTTGVLRADLTVEKGDIKIDLPIETTFLPSINAWWIVGPFEVPFEKAMDTSFPPEEKIDLAAQYEGKDKQSIGWKQMKRPIGPDANLADEFFVDLTGVFGGRKYNAVAYALAYLIAPEDTDATLALGSDDGVAVWLNGKEIHRVPGGRAYMSKQDRVPVHLEKGANTLLLKIIQGGGDWGFCVHVEDAKGRPLTKVRASLSADAGK
ncbi:MAG TPA: TIM-barrel domain-containing protein [Phycisphaerae bacterium]|nr:TIM-barrel domain-containing protein [Phycisphaerae bacterium]